MSLEPDSTPSRVPPLLVSNTSPYPPPRSSFSQKRHEAFSDDMFRSATDLQVSSVESSGSQGHLASLKAEEAANRRFQATTWIKSMVGSLDIQCEPSKEEFRICLRNGIILCNLINKVQPGTISKVVENHVSSHPPEGWPLSTYQYFENVRNFLVAAEEMNLPTFEATHLEQESLWPGSTTKIVDCILALKDLMVYEVSVQMIEVYNEQVRDLLGALTSSKKLDIRNNGHKGFNGHSVLTIQILFLGVTFIAALIW